MSLLIQDDIFGFYIPIYYILLMQVLQSHQCFHNIKLSRIFTHSPLLLQQFEKFPSRNKLHYDNIKVVSFNEIIGLYYVRMVQTLSNLKLIVDQFNISSLFEDEFSSKKNSRSSTSEQVNLRKTTN